MKKLTLFETLLPYQQKFVRAPQRKKFFLSSRQIGKSWTVGFQLIHAALTSKSKLALAVSVNQRSSHEIILKAAKFAEAAKVLSNGQLDFQVSAEKIEFANGARVLSLPQSSDGAAYRGFTAGLVAIDECCFIRNLDALLQAIGPTLSRDPTAQLVCTSTPSGRNTRGYELFQQACANPEEWYVQQTTIHDAMKDGLKMDLDSLHALCPETAVFAVEYECRWADAVNPFLDLDLLQFTDDIPSDGETYLGGDIARTHDNTVFVILRKHRGVFYVVDVVQLNNCPYDKQFAVLKEIYNKWRPSSGYLDANGLGGPLAEAANKHISARIHGFQTTASNKSSLYEDCRSHVLDRKLVFSSQWQDLARRDIQGVERILGDDGKLHYQSSRNAHGHCDFSSALVLGLRAAKEHPANATACLAVPRSSVFGAPTWTFQRF